MPVQVRVATAGERAELHRLRRDVFVVGLGVPPHLERDEFDEDALHVVAVTAGAVVGTGRLVRGEASGLVGRIAVSPAARGRGVGAALLAELERLADGLAVVELHAQRHAQGFYERAGYRSVGAPYIEAGIAHVTMRKALPFRRAARDADSAAIIALIGGCFAEYPGCVLDLPGIDAWMLAPAAAYPGSDDRLWVVTLDGGVVATVGVKPAPAGRAELKSLYVDPSARRRGLGSALIAVVEEHARGIGRSHVQLWTDTRFTAAHRRYEDLGYRRGPTTRRLDDPSDTTEYFYDKPLPG